MYSTLFTLTISKDTYSYEIDFNRRRNEEDASTYPKHFLKVTTKIPSEPYKLKDEDVIYFTMEELSEEVAEKYSEFLFKLAKQKKKETENIIKIPEDIANEILLKLKNLYISYLPLNPANQIFGVDGTSFKLKFGLGSPALEFYWWMRAPQEWKDLEDVVELIKNFVIII